MVSLGDRGTFLLGRPRGIRGSNITSNICTQATVTISEIMSLTSPSMIINEEECAMSDIFLTLFPRCRHKNIWEPLVYTR
jgi:hypothetical protein